MWECQRNARGFVLGWIKSHLRVYPLGLVSRTTGSCCCGHLLQSTWSGRTNRWGLLQTTTRSVISRDPGLHGDFNHLDMAEGQYSSKQCRIFPKCIGDGLMTQVIKELIRDLLDLILANKAKLVRNVKAGGSLTCRDHKMLEFSTLIEGNMGSQHWSSRAYRGTTKEVDAGLGDPGQTCVPVHRDRAGQP